MQSTLLLGAATLAAVAFADVSIDVSKGAQVATENAALVSSITANPIFQSDASALAAVLPSSIVAAAESDPEAVVEALLTATGLPTTATAIPSDALDSLASIAAVPIVAGEDIASYVASAINDPKFASAQSVLATAVPSRIQPLIKEDPAAFLAGGITASVTPAYLSSLPTGIQSELASFINGGLDILASDLAATSASVYNYNNTASMTTSAVSANNTTGSVSTGNPTPYTGAATAFNANTIGATLIVAGAAVLALL